MFCGNLPSSMLVMTAAGAARCMITTHRLNSSTPDPARSSRAKAAPAGRINQARRRVNYTHSGFMLSVAGFTWLLAAAIVLIVRTPLNVWAGFLTVVASVTLAGRIRRRLGARGCHCRF